MRRSAILASVVMLAMSFAPPVLAQGKGKGRYGTTNFGLTLNMFNDVNRDGLPNWGDSVTFTVSTTEKWNQVNVTCSQSGVLVYGAVWPNTQVLTLSSTAWYSGAADCTAVVIAFDSRKVLASVSFTVDE